MKQIFHWSKTSYALLSVFLMIIFIIGYVWWPLLKEYIELFDKEQSIWLQIDWLLIGNFLIMTILIMLNANLKHDIPFLLIALVGGFIIESWGTQSGLWTYYTDEKPPLWIVPAWPIAALSVNRLYHIALKIVHKLPTVLFNWLYWLIFGSFFIILVRFIMPTILHPLTIVSIILCFSIIILNSDRKSAVLILLMGSILGYFLERWGTTRLCWTYYTGGYPPLPAVLSHGMASVAVWWVFTQYVKLMKKTKVKWVAALIPE